jgi:hypothetical protein
VLWLIWIYLILIPDVFLYSSIIKSCEIVDILVFLYEGFELGANFANGLYCGVFGSLGFLLGRDSCLSLRRSLGLMVGLRFITVGMF